MKEIKTIKAYTLDQIREYLIINDVEVNSREDIIALYLKMRGEKYFYKADVNESLDVVKETFKDLAEAFEKDKDILEKDLIFFGSKKALEKMENNKIKR